jgi:hypothetical protein
MSLVVDRIKCVEESDELDSDDIYLVVFRGRTVSPFDTGLGVHGGAGSLWADYDSGELEGTDVTIAHTNADAVYAVMLVEQDHALDIKGSAVIGAWAMQTDLIWKAQMLSVLTGGGSPGSEQSKTNGYAKIQNALNGLSSIYMEFPKGDDDSLGVKRVTITKAGQSQTVRYRSNAEDATYDVAFKHT